MLQQTRVETVIPYFERWMRAFPSVSILADADEREVLKAWEGLGYYSRARNAHRTAKIVRERPSARFPDSAARLRELPGIGEYTSGAIASIAFGEPVPAVDGNVRRVLSRLFDLERPSGGTLRELATALVPEDRPGDWNEALMELGALVCTPRNPRCVSCPLSSDCGAFEAGTVSERPGPRSRGKVRAASFVSLVARDPAGRFFVTRRPAEGLLGGLWECPTVESDGDGARVVGGIAEDHGLRLAGGARTLPEVRHAFTHIRATYRPFVVDASGGSETEDSGWRTSEELDALPLPVAQQRIIAAARASAAHSP
jgi:A/G-specific adenine glycosylase